VSKYPDPEWSGYFFGEPALLKLEFRHPHGAGKILFFSCALMVLSPGMDVFRGKCIERLKEGDIQTDYQGAPLEAENRHLAVIGI
jgi:hypothetical protein